MSEQNVMTEPAPFVLPTIPTIPPNDWYLEIVPPLCGCGSMTCGGCGNEFMGGGTFALRRRSIPGYLCFRCVALAPAEALRAYNSLINPPTPPKAEPIPPAAKPETHRIVKAFSWGWKKCSACGESFWRPGGIRFFIVRKKDDGDLCFQCNREASREICNEVSRLHMLRDP